MIKSTCLSLIFAMLVAIVARAQTTIDVAQISCDQFVLMTVANPDDIAIWLSGYYHGKQNNTSIDVQQLKDTAQRVRSYCLYNGKGRKLMEVVEELLAPNK